MLKLIKHIGNIYSDSKLIKHVGNIYSYSQQTNKKILIKDYLLIINAELIKHIGNIYLYS